VNYTLPFTSPGTFEGRIFYMGNPTSLIAPPGVQLKGEGLRFRGQEPKFRMSIYQTMAAAYKVEIVLQRPQTAETEQNDPQIQFVLPKLYNKLAWVLALWLSIPRARFRAAVPFGAAGSFCEKVRKNERVP
jgi:hypothetical protein